MNRLVSVGSAVVLGGIAVLVSAPAEAGAWMRSGGEYRYSAGLSHSRADQYYDADEVRQDAGCTANDLYLDQDLEYGHSYYHTLFGKFSAARKSCGGETSTEGGDLELGIRGRLNPLRNGRTWEASLLIPTEDSTSDPARLGVGSYGLQLGLHGRFAAGGSVLRQRHLSTGAEVRLWEGDPSDRLRTYIDYSWPLYTLEMKVGVNGDFSLRNGSGESDWDTQRRPTDDYERVNVGGSIRKSYGEWSVQYRISHVVWGWNTDASTTVGVSISRSWME